MTIDPNKVLYVYNANDEYSESLALEYSLVRQIPSINLLGINSITSSVYQSRLDFEQSLLDQILAKIDSLGSFPNTIHACILGYRVPAGYVEENYVISCCSAVAAAFTGKDSVCLNPAYRKSEISAELYDFNVMPCCQHDLPAYGLMKKKIAEFSGYRNGILSNGYLYFDRWSLKEEYGYDYYAEELSSFEQNFIKNYFKSYLLTSEPIDNLRSDFGFASSDSFFWSAGLQNLTTSFFLTQNRLNRIFFFNADTDSFKSFRSDNVFGPAIAALDSGYISAAGMMSDLPETELILDQIDPYDIKTASTVSCWLRPEPFFYSASKDYTLLESMYFASPLLCSPMTYFCDPLCKVIFNNDLSIPSKFSPKESWSRIHEILSQCSALLLRRINSATALTGRAGTYRDVNDKIWALDRYRGISTNNTLIQISSQVNPAFSAWKKFAEIAYFDQFDGLKPSFIDIINNLDFKLTNAFIRLNINSSQLNEKIDTVNKEVKGSFIIETYLPEINLGTGFYQIKADIYLDQLDSSPFISSTSFAEKTSWLVEDFDKTFKNFPNEGLFSSLTSRKIKFYNRKEIQDKNIGDNVWVKLTFTLDYTRSYTTDFIEALIIS